MRTPVALGAAVAAASLLVPARAAGAADAVPALQGVARFSTGGQEVAGMALAPDGRVFYVGPGTASVLVWTPGSGVSTFATVPSGTAGFGIVLSPGFASDHRVYVFAQVRTPTVPHELLLRWTDAGGTGTGRQVLRDLGPAGTDHKGGKMVWSPDGRSLFLVVGDAGSPSTSQDPSDEHGKVLRLDASGRPAPGNPASADPAVWASGVRNSIGMAFDPVGGRLWESENGPECNDEINLLVAGGNYGWGPSEVCDGTVTGTNQDGASPRLPKRAIDPVVAPTGLTFCSGCRATADGTLVYGRYLTSQLRAVTLTGPRTGIAQDALLYTGPGKITAVESSPVDGSIWFADETWHVRQLR